MHLVIELFSFSAKMAAQAKQQKHIGIQDIPIETTLVSKKESKKVTDLLLHMRRVKNE